VHFDTCLCNCQCILLLLVALLEGAMLHTKDLATLTHTEGTQSLVPVQGSRQSNSVLHVKYISYFIHCSGAIHFVL